MEKWALILGASSGFGGATAIELAKDGYNIIGVHLDRQATMPKVNQTKESIEATGQKAIFFNTNAADQFRRNDTLDEIKEMISGDGSKINVLMHTLAFGALRPYVGKTQEEVITPAQMSMTLDVMAHSLVYWTQGLLFRDMFADNGRIFAMSSAGSQTVIPAYGAVAAAKASLEAHIRQLAVELGPMKITANTIMAGVTDTPALRKIPGSDLLLKSAKAKNPQNKLTTAEEVARAIALLSKPEADWISGNVIGVDGGEFIVNYLGE